MRVKHPVGRTPSHGHKFPVIRPFVIVSFAGLLGFRFFDSDPYIDRIVSFEPGEGAGFGQDKQPDIVLGAPRGRGKLEPSDHVLSLGKGGKITLEFVDNEVFDGEGPDFIVFENAFLKVPGDDPGNGFFELAKVEVSADGKEWKLFPFDRISRKGCAGYHPVFANPDENDISPTDPEKAGGDAFDLRDVELKMIRFVRITDLDNATGGEGTMGFDLDAVAAVHSRPRKKEDADK
jgi:hypothetical protein